MATWDAKRFDALLDAFIAEPKKDSPELAELKNIAVAEQKKVRYGSRRL